MKKLSDYKGEEAIELWGDLLDPICTILSDEAVRNLIKNREKKSPLQLATKIIKLHKAEVAKAFKIIDPTEELDGINIIMRLANILAEIGSNSDLRSFFGFAEQSDTENASIGSAMESTEDGEK